MLNLIQFNLVTLLVALAIGIAAGRWMFSRPSPPAPTPEDSPQS